MSLRTRILLLVLLATLAPALALSFYLLEHRQQDIEEEEHSLAALAKYAAENLDDKIKGTVQLLHGLSRAPDIDTRHKASCSEFLADVLARYPQYTGLLTITPDGELHCDSLRSGRSLNVSGRAYFKQASASLEPAFDVVFGGLTGIAVLQVAYPVLDGQGTLKYVLLASLNLSQYAQSFSAASQHQSIKFLIWNRTGNLMVRKPDTGDAKLIGKDYSASELFRFAATGNSITTAELPDLDGASRVWAIGVIPEARSGGTRITLGIPRSVLVADANRSLRNALAILLVVSLLAFTGAWFVAEAGIRRHVRRITGVAGRVGGGDLAARIGAPYPGGELGELMAVFDRASDAVQVQQAVIDLRSRDLQRANRTLHMLSSINSLIARVRERQELLTEACRIAVEHGNFGIAWVGRYDPATLDVTPVAWAGLEAEEYLGNTKSTARDDLPQGQGAVGRAIRELRPVFNNDISAESGVGSVRRAEALRRGYRSVIVLPLIVEGAVTAIFSMFAKELNYFDDEEVKLLAELAGNVSFALEHMARQEKLEKLSRIRAVLGEINATIARVRDRQELFDAACGIAVEQGRLASAWIGSLDPATLDITPVAWAGEGSEEMRTAVSTARDEPPRGQGAVSLAVRERRVVVDNELSLHNFGGPRREAMLKLGFNSLIALPLLEGDAIVGTFSLCARESGFFDENEIALLTELAGNVSFALEHMARQQHIERLSRIRAVSSEINAAIVRSRNKQVLFYEACRIAVEHGKFGIAWIGEFDAEKLEVSPVASVGLEDSTFSMRTVLSVRANTAQGEGMLPRAVRERRPVYNNDITVNPEQGGERRKEAISRGYRSVIVLPLIVDGAVKATFSMFAKELNYFDEGETALLTGLAADVSFALEHMARQQRIEKLSRIRAISSEVNAAIVRIHERHALLKDTCRIASEQGGFEMVWIGTIDQEKQQVVPVCWAGFSSETAHAVSWKSMSAAQGALGEAIRIRKAAVRNDIQSELPVGGLRGEALSRGCMSSVCLPVMVDDNVVALIVLFATGTGFFDKDELTLLDEVASNISLALGHIARQEKIEKLSRVRAMTSEINSAIVRAQHRQQLLEEACRIAVDFGGFGIVWVGMLDPATRDLKAAAMAGAVLEYGKLLQPSVRGDIPAGQGTNGRAFREKKPIVENDMAADQNVGVMRAEGLQFGIRAALSLPLLVEGSAVGVMGLYAREKDYFNEAEISLLTEVAGNISFALEHMAGQEKIEKLSRIRAVSSEVNAAIVHIRERQALLKETCRIALKQGKFELIWIGEIDQDARQIQALTWAGFPEDIARSVTWDGITATHGTMHEAFKTRKVTARNDIETQMGPGTLRSVAVQHGCRSTVCLPLVVDDRVVALISLYAAGKDFFDADELALLGEVATNISFALEQIERADKFARLSRIEAVMGSISELIVRVADRDELFREACRIAVEEGRFRMSLIGIVDRSTMQVVPVATAGKDEALQASIKGILASSENAPKTMIARAIREKKAVVSNDSQSDPGVLFSRQYVESGVHSMAVLPLIVSDEAVGVLALYSEETGFFDEEELKLLEELTGNIAFAIDHIAKQERLDYLAYYDALTGLANRTLFLERVAQSIRSAASGGHKLALFLIDLERFKNINDSLGRTAGDELLKQVAAWMTGNLGDANLLARVDADHFAVVLPEVRQEGDVARLMEKTMDAFLEHSFPIRDAVLRVGAKVGVALFPDDGADADTLFRNAEAALKKAKSSGERYLFYTKKMTEAVASKLALENQLREALDNEEFVLHYQPKIDLASGEVCGLEALIRWQKPGTGLVPPGVFIPLLEETGLILGVGKWALTKALAQHREWAARGIAAPRIAVNVSAIQLQQKDFTNVVTGALREQGNNPDALEIEVTESLLMQDVGESIRTLTTLRGLGIHIAMDDFGTGHSSLSYLARLPLNSLKIDRSFITEMANNPQDMSIVTTIVALAHSLNLRVVAEGVETPAQSQLLKLLKCDEAQGYLFSKPLPAAEIEPLLRTLALEESAPEPA